MTTKQNTLQDFLDLPFNDYFSEVGLLGFAQLLEEIIRNRDAEKMSRVEVMFKRQRQLLEQAGEEKKQEQLKALHNFVARIRYPIEHSKDDGVKTSEAGLIEQAEMRSGTPEKLFKAKNS